MGQNIMGNLLYPIARSGRGAEEERDVDTWRYEGKGCEPPEETIALRWRRELPIDVVSLALGAMMFLSPWIFGFAPLPAPTRTALVTGALISFVSLQTILIFAKWQEWINLVLGSWLVASPWLVGFHTSARAMWVHVTIGIAVAVLAAIELLMVDRPPPRAAE
jgi:SPW repeat